MNTAARRGTARRTAHIRRPCAPRAAAGAGVGCGGRPDPRWPAAGDAADRRVACRPSCNRPSDCWVACHHAPGRLVRPRKDPSKGNASRNARYFRQFPVGSCRALRRIVRNTNVDSQRLRQNLPGVDSLVAPLVVEREYGVGAPDGDMPLQRPHLTVSELAWIALPQLVEHRSAVSFRLCSQPPADLIPNCCERIGAATVRARALGLLSASVFAFGRAVWVQPDDGLGSRLIVASTARAEIEAQRHEVTRRRAAAGSKQRMAPERLL